MSQEVSMTDLFVKKEPIVKEIYTKLINKIGKFGIYKEEPHKTSIHLVNRSAFAGVETRKEYILLNIKSVSEIKSKRVVSVDHVSSNRFHNVFKIKSPDEIDPELLKWLQEAYQLSA